LKTTFDLPENGTLGTIEIEAENGTKTYLVGHLSPEGPQVIFVGSRKLAFTQESTAVHVAAVFNTVNRLGGLESVKYDALFNQKPKAEKETKNEEPSAPKN
jgi:hypothetical protein